MCISLAECQQQVSNILSKASKVRVTVFGDFCLDAYWNLSDCPDEISLETGLTVRCVTGQRYSLGGAGSVVANLRSLGVEHVRAVGLAGDDLFGHEMMRLLREKGANLDGFLQVPEWQTMVYAKPYDGDREESRIDFGSCNEIHPEVADRLLKNLREAALQSDIVVLNQQVMQGLSSPAMIERLNDLSHEIHGAVVIADARHHPHLYRNVVLKLNLAEALKMIQRDAEAPIESDWEQLALKVHQRTGKAVFITRGEQGIAAAWDGGTYSVPGLQVSGRTDSVGAGDAVVAALAAGLGGGASPAVAAVFANIAAMTTVKKLQSTGAAEAAEILGALDDLQYAFRPELAESPRNAHYLSGSQIELVTGMPGMLRIRHCIFDHDGTLSVLREGWEQIMEPMMLRAILGSRYESVDAKTFQRVREEVNAFIDRTTGIQTLVQMQGLVELVRQSGFVPQDEVLNEHGYKGIYNEELLKMVNQRVEKLRAGELESNDFQVKNAGLLLKSLVERGVKLYLASGTDEEDVIAEAEAMGYADCFQGRIFGARGRVDLEAKKIVLERIIRENSLQGHEFAVFGDGPVEIRETQRRGGFCVGVASDELRRFGWNMAKRKRLIRAGADVVVPDYSQLPKLLELMQLN